MATFVTKSLAQVVPLASGRDRILVYTKETRIKRDTCTPMFITALFIIARSEERRVGKEC